MGWAWKELAKMVDVINIAVGAMLGVILANSPFFKINGFSDMYTLSLFVVLIILFSCNIWITSRSIARRRYSITVISIAAYFIMELSIFFSYTLAPSLLPIGQEGVVFKFTGLLMYGPLY